MYEFELEKYIACPTHLVQTRHLEVAEGSFIIPRFTVYEFRRVNIRTIIRTDPQRKASKLKGQNDLQLFPRVHGRVCGCVPRLDYESRM